MAQRDNALNMATAETSLAVSRYSKRDSTYMRTIAAITLVFLPGTFMAVSHPSSHLFPKLTGIDTVRYHFLQLRWDWANCVALVLVVLGIYRCVDLCGIPGMVLHEA
jgi:hypothetical protein